MTNACDVYRLAKTGLNEVKEKSRNWDRVMGRSIGRHAVDSAETEREVLTAVVDVQVKKKKDLVLQAPAGSQKVI